MAEKPSKPVLVDVEARVRGNTGPAAFAGAILVFFGYFWFSGAGETDAGSAVPGQNMLVFTLRLGGLLMIAIAVWCSIGVPLALLLDAALSVVIGAFIVLSAGLIAAGNGVAVAPVIYVICGAIIITTGVRDLADYRRLPAEEEGGDNDAHEETVEELAAANESLIGQDGLADPPPAADPSVKRTGRRSAKSRPASDRRAANLGNRDYRAGS